MVKIFVYLLVYTFWKNTELVEKAFLCAYAGDRLWIR